MINQEKDKLYLISLVRKKNIKVARRDFWEYCKLRHPSFYKNDREYLYRYCQVLQVLYERKLLKPDGTPYLRLIIRMPPQSGKTRTLVLWEEWVFGQNPKEMIITCAYNTDTAIEFSQYVRDGIMEERGTDDQIIYADIFPNTRIKQGNASRKTWALEGSHFSYRGTGMSGSLTSKGATIKIIDDPIKSMFDAFNANYTEKLWKWYTGTYMSRNAPGAPPLEILNHTPWVSDDLQSRILHSDEKDDWYVFEVKAFENGQMFCEDVLSMQQYRRFEKSMDKFVFQANYNMTILDANVLLYGDNFKTYAKLPLDIFKRNDIFTLKAWADTADTGEDFFTNIFGVVYKGYCYVLDIVHTDEDVRETVPLVAGKLLEHRISEFRVEANSGGHAIAVHIQDKLENELKWYGTIFQPFTQTENKESRILGNVKQVLDRVIMPDDWQHKWPSFYQAATMYKRKGKNAHDDVPDVLTMIVEDITTGRANYFFNDEDDAE